MNVLVVPMFALSRMGGPWGRAQTVAAAFENAGHHVVLAMADDGNCVDPCVADTCQLPVPSPLGLPSAISSRTFPMAEKLGVSGRKPVRSFEEVLWLTGALAYRYERESVDVLCRTIEKRGIDAVYSEFSLPAIIAAQKAGVPVFGSFSFTTQTLFASSPKKAGGVRKLLRELGLPQVGSSLELFDRLELRFVPSCPELEPIDDGRTEFVGFLRDAPRLQDAERDCVVVYLGAGSVPQSKIQSVVPTALDGFGGEVFVAGCASERSVGNVHFAPRFDFSELLSRACCFVHHGGQNSTMDALAYGVPQVVVPGRVFERIYNAQSIERVGAGVKIDSMSVDALRDACHRVVGDPAFAEATRSIRRSLSECGGASRIVSAIEESLSLESERVRVS